MTERPLGPTHGDHPGHQDAGGHAPHWAHGVEGGGEVAPDGCGQGYGHEHSHPGYPNSYGHDQGYGYGHDVSGSQEHHSGELHYTDPYHSDPSYSDASYGVVPDSRRSRRQTARAGRGPRRVLVLLLALGLIAGAGYLGVVALKPLFDRSGDVADFPGPGSTPVTFTVKDGDTGRAIGNSLQGAGIVLTARAFVDACNADTRCAGIQPGDYALKKEMRAADVLTVLVDPKNRQNPKVTIREGLWASEIYALLAKATKRPVAEYEAAAKSPEVRALLPSSANGNVEGYLFPATYEFSDKDTAVAQLSAMVGKAAKVLADLKVQPDQAEKLMIIASIVEAEAKRPDNRAKVARVVLNRLAQPMRLQLDSTVSYAAKKRAVTTTDAERAAVNGWNTYTKDGLPDTPIANPGLAAIEAAVAPAAGPWLFFVAVNPETGETKFTESQAEHDQFVAEFQAWCNLAENKGKCAR